jgi:large subunit ribosomal protein L14
MLLKGSYLNYADNSGVKSMQCVRVIGGSSKKTSTTGNLIKVVVKSLRSKKKVALKKIYYGIVVGVKKKKSRLDGSFIRFHENRVVILSDQKKFLGTRVYGPVSKEIKGGKSRMRFRKILSCSDGTV